LEIIFMGLTNTFLSYIFLVNMEEDQNTQATTEQKPADQPQSPPGAQEEQEEQKSKKKVVIILIVIAIILIGGGAYFLLGGSGGSSGETPTPSPRSTPASAPEPTGEPEEVDRANVTINILNGTGIEGEATYLSDELKELGYTKIEAGNADRQDYTATVVTFSQDVDEGVKEEITDLCEATYQNVKVVSGSPGVYDVEVITGLRPGMTPKPEATDKPEATSTPEAETPSPTPED
jgi:hypothetical protein